MKSERKPDRYFIILTATLVAVGLFIFLSATLSVIAINKELFYSNLMSQLVYGLVGGLAALWIMYKMPLAYMKKFAFWAFIFSIILTALVFIPGLGFSHGGATRWISLGPISFQPAEFLKLAFVIYLAAWLSWVKGRVGDIKFGLVPFALLIGLAGVVLLLQPDTGTLLVIIATGVVMYFIAGSKWRDLGIFLLIGIIGFGALVATRPYLIERIKTFGDPGRDPLGSSYQIQQSLIAIGSGRITGRGFGQSVQKFSYLPEATGDTIFAVAAEEFGFVGGVVLILLFILFAMRGLKIAQYSPNMFSRLLVTGTVILIVSQSFLNIASVIGVFPFTGLPLIFVSQGGTALLFSLAGVGIILNVSKSVDL